MEVGDSHSRILTTGVAGSVFCVTEKWIRGKLNLTKTPVENIQSLALPGGHSEKITHLGRSLLSFTRLTHLDLSRNALESLQGLNHLEQLESLNIYYNKISSLKDLYLLHHNSKLKELDLRLNPVTHHEPDYRLFLIHMLLHLRTLDERAVIDSERRASIMHFTTAQACLPGSNKRTDEILVAEHEKRGAQCTELVDALGPHPALQDNTDELLELAQSGDDIVPSTKAQLQSSGYNKPMKVNLLGKKSVSGRSCGKVGDEDEANSGFRVNVNFTPAPQSTVTCVNQSNMRGESQMEESSSNFDIVMAELITLLQQYIPTDITFLFRDLTLKDEIHKLWKQDTTTESQQKKGLQQELDHLRQQLDRKQSALESRDLELNRLRKIMSEQKSMLEAKSLQLVQVQQDVHLKNDITQLLKQANTNILSLLQHMRQLQEENAQIKAALEKSPKAVEQLKLIERIGELETAKATLESELSSNHQRRQSEAHAYTKLQELTAMLQESQRSLVTTNDHLLKELETIKLKHSQEVSQMLKNYQHLKNTHSYLLDTSHK